MMCVTLLVGKCRLLRALMPTRHSMRQWIFVSLVASKRSRKPDQ